MEILRRRPADLPVPHVDIAVVVDVLRMTSTAAALMRRPSCAAVGVAATLDDLDRLPDAPGDLVIVSELADAERLGTRIDNSPAQASCMELVGRRPVLVTTNGTRALLSAAGCAERVLLGSFNDVRELAQYVAAAGASRVLLLPAGHIPSGQDCIEDDLCADAFEALVLGRDFVLSEAAAVIRADARIARRCEAEAGFESDLDLALQCDSDAVVLEFFALDNAVGNIVPVQ